MPVVPCPECAKKLNVPDAAVGKRVKCPGCGAAFAAGAEGPAPAPARKPEPPASLKKGDRVAAPELSLADEPPAQRLGDTIPGLRCAACGAEAVAKLAPNQFSRHPGYVCTECDALMRRPGTTGNYYAAAALGAFMVLLGLALAVFAFQSEDGRTRMVGGGFLLAVAGMAVAAWAGRQAKLPVPVGATAPPARVGFWVAVLVIGLLVLGGIVFGLLYVLNEML